MAYNDHVCNRVAALGDLHTTRSFLTNQLLQKMGSAQSSLADWQRLWNVTFYANRPESHKLTADVRWM